MSTRDMGIFRNRLEEALVWNREIMSLLSQAAKEGITISFAPRVENDTHTLVVHVFKKENRETIGAQMVINPEHLLMIKGSEED